MRTRLPVLAAVAAGLLLGNAHAQTAPAGAGAATLNASAGNLVQTIVALMLVLGLLVGLAWFLKRYGPKPGRGTAPVKLVGSLALGGRERIIVVEVGEQWIVVGASPGRVNALATMPKQAGAPAELAPHSPAADNFGAWLKHTIDKRNAD
ncbi:MAG: flagellar biosynthetic protein FliO [Pseudomonadota bacterium]